MRHVLFPLAGIILMSAALVGCGQKGPLTLPAKPVEATTPAPPPVEPDSKPTPADPKTDAKTDANSAASPVKGYKQVSRHAA